LCVVISFPSRRDCAAVVALLLAASRLWTFMKPLLTNTHATQPLQWQVASFVMEVGTPSLCCMLPAVCRYAAPANTRTQLAAFCANQLNIIHNH